MSPFLLNVLSTKQFVAMSHCFTVMQILLDATVVHQEMAQHVSEMYVFCLQVKRGDTIINELKGTYLNLGLYLIPYSTHNHE